MKLLTTIFICICLLSDMSWAGDHMTATLEASLKRAGDREKIKILNELARAHWKTSQKKSIFYGKQALKLAEASDDKAEKANALINLGVAHKKLSDYDEALSYYLGALKLREDIGDKKGVADSLHHIGVIYDYLKKYDDALVYLHDALDIREEIGDKKGTAHSFHNMGVIYHQMGRYVRALEYYQEALKIRQEIGDKKGIAGTMNNIGIAYKDIINYPKSLEYYLDALRRFDGFGDKYEVANISNNIGQLFLHMQDYDNAFSYLEKGLKLAQEIEAKELVRENHMFRSDVYAEKGDYQKALECYRLSSQVRDQIFTEESGKKIADMQTKYETEKKEKEIELLKKDNHISQLELGKQRLLKNSLLAGFCFVLLLAFVMYNRYRLKKKAHAELEAAHRIIKEEKEKSDKLLLNILPLRVANNLKEKGRADPESYDNVTVYFSDIVGFTKLSTKLDPIFLIDELNDIFTAFDNIIERNLCERIKTIGDAYLCVSGMPEENPNHAENIVRSAIEIIRYLKDRSQHSDIQWEIRIGIHSGKVVGGVVGVKKYIYDVFGDTINTASRMESNSKPMRINVSEITYQIVKDKFRFIERESISVKGKGMMKMYFVEG